jgi:hypothetical protein
MVGAALVLVLVGLISDPNDDIELPILGNMPSRHIEKSAGFLHLADNMTPTILGQPINQYVSFRSLALRRLAKRLPPILGRLIGRLIMRTKASYPPIDRSSQRMLIEFFRQPNADFEGLVGSSIPEWAA